MAIKIYDLSQPFGRNTPMWPGNNMLDIQIERVAFPERDSFTPGFSKYTNRICTRFHVSTHMDAPAHVIPEGLYIDEIPLERCYGTGVVVDMRHLKKWDIIGAKELDNAKPKIEEGDFVIINTGWHHYWRKNNYVYFNHYPGCYEEAGKWFVDHKVKAVGITGGASDTALAHYPMYKLMPWLRDEYMAETGKDPDKEFPIHEPCHQALARAGIPGIENVGGEVDLVTDKRCTLVAFPIRFEEGDGSIVRLVAIVEE